MTDTYLYSLTQGKKLDQIGNKANNLRSLARNGFHVPRTHICTWKAFESFQLADQQVLVNLQRELASELDSQKHYAVRSSANLEDGHDLSFAGQFNSFLNIQGVEEIIKSIEAIWSTIQSPSVESYLAQNEIDRQDLKMGIIIQEMVSPMVSGVSFSRNPITGLDEVIVEAVRGSGEALVQDGVSPQRWVNKWGTWTEYPGNEFHEDLIAIELIEKIVDQTKVIAKTFQRHVDLEWVYDGQDVYWVQMREITSLDIPIYSNRISKEVFPGIIKPLIWSVNVPLVNRAWLTMFTEIIGPNDIKPESLAGRYFSRAYFNISTLGQIFALMGSPKDTLELLLGIEVRGPERPSFKPTIKTFLLLPRIVRFVFDKVRFGRKIDRFISPQEKIFQTFEIQAEDSLSECQLLAKIDNLSPLVQETAYYNTVIALLARLYNKILQEQLKGLDIEFDDFDLMGGMPELEKYDPNFHLAGLSQEYKALSPNIQNHILTLPYKELSKVSGTGALLGSLSRFIEQFGHLSDSSSDFSQEPWRENPDLVWQMVINYIPPTAKSATRVKLEAIDLPAFRRWFFNWIYHRARRYQWHREAISSLYTYGYGLFRGLFLSLGHHFVVRNLLTHKEDIFYLDLIEVRMVVEENQSVLNLRDLVKKRKDQISQLRDIIPPETIFGDQEPSLEAPDGEGMKGVPTSRGVYTGAVRVMKGLQDLNKIKPGDVLVVPYSDVGWTPLFTKAGAIVAESGGILSHCSIVAREYGIPAVVSVPGACQLADDTLVKVDGHNGIITIKSTNKILE